MSERDIQRAIVDWLELWGFCCWRVYLGPRMIGKQLMAKNPMAGFPDIAGVFSDGRLFVIEVKSRRGRLSDDQERWLERLSARNVLAIVARSVADVERAFEKEMPCSPIRPTR